MLHRLDPPLTPRDRVTLRVVGVCRISGPNQDPRSLDDQQALLRGFLADRYDGPVEWAWIQSQGSGERLDSAALQQLDALVRTSAIDLVLAEDSGRVCRRVNVVTFCENWLDRRTRFITLLDHIDTAHPSWRTFLMQAATRHEMYNFDTAARIRRSQRNRFRGGGMIASFPYGYHKPPGAKTDDLVSRIPDAGPVYDDWFARLEAGATFAEVADRLNDLGIPPGPSARAGRWTGHLVRNTTYNPILKGLRIRNRLVSERVHSTGRHHAVPAPPEELLTREVPHLAFVDPARYDRVVALLKARNAWTARAADPDDDPRRGVPRSRTAWPGQHLACGVCGRRYYYGGHGQKGYMACSGMQAYLCWNSVSLDGADAARRLAGAILAEAAALADFDDVLLRDLRAEAHAARDAARGRRADAARALGRARERAASTTDLLVDSPGSTSLRAKLRELEADRDRLAARLAELDARAPEVPEPPSLERVRATLAEAFAGLAASSPEFGRLMHRLVTRLEVLPHVACDGGALVLRARLDVDLAALVPEARGSGLPGGLLTRKLVVDLFDPPQRVAHLARVRELLARGLDQRGCARELGITQTAVYYAVRLARRMDALGLADPYVALPGPPPGRPKMKRHRHPRYRFTPLPGHPRPGDDAAPGTTTDLGDDRASA